MTIRIGNASGFLGDSLSAVSRMVEHEQLDYLTLEYLAELTLSILAHSREKEPQAGYARDFLDVVQALCPALYLQGELKLVTNAGGMNPRSCAEAAGRILRDNGSENLPIAVVLGDDIRDRLEEFFILGCSLENLETGQPLSELNLPVVSANAYLGAPPITEALADGARLVITGRVADASLTVGPAVYEFGWDWHDWDRLAGASTAGHLIECGAQVTGGYSTGWANLDLADIGYPIAEIDQDAQLTITKPQGTGGAVNRQTVVEQLVYEIGDPAHYLTPDVDVDFTKVEVDDEGRNRVKVWGASGHAAPSDYKVSLAYHAGYTAAAQLLVYGHDCLAKARASADIIFDRVGLAGFQLDQTQVELLGTGDALPGLEVPPPDLREVVLRVAVHDRRREAVTRFAKEVAPLITSGPAGLAGYAGGRIQVRPAYAHWPALVPRDLVQPNIEVRTANDWQFE